LRWTLQLGGAQLQKALRKRKSRCSRAIVDRVPEENAPFRSSPQSLLHPLQVVVCGQKIIIEKGNDVRLTKRMFKAEVALGG
jgi:hypothetical protein